MAIDGLLASLIYLDDTRSSATHVPNAELRDMARWQDLLHFRFEVEQYWNSLADITQTEHLPGLDSLIKAFHTPVQLYEAAIFTFRNISTGLEPDSLENVFAPFSLSYVASICSQRMGKPDIDNIFRDINIGQDSIGDPQNRQLFNDLIQRFFIANCGDLIDILGGHGVTANGPHSDVSKEIKNFTQALRLQDSFEELSAQGLLVIVDRFVDLKYFQDIDEIRDYIIVVGKEILPSGKSFAKSNSVNSQIVLKTPSCKFAKNKAVSSSFNSKFLMEENSPFHGAISAIDGLLACLIYFDKSGSGLSATLHGDLRHQIDRYWERLRQIASAQTIPSLTTLIKSFRSPTQFYEMAIFTFRNVLVGVKPDSLNAIFPLCSLSYITSCCLRSYDNFRDIELWQNAIRNPQEREVFINLAGVVWPQAALTPIDDVLNSQMITVIGPGASAHQNQSLALGFDFLQEEWLFGDLHNAVWEPDVMPDSSVAINVENLHRTSSTLEDLQGSAIVSNIICFLTEESGDLLHVFSGRGVTSKDLYSCIAFTQGGSEAKNVVGACVKRLQSDEASQSPSTAGIVTIVERFVELGYLQTPEELRKYMLCVGRRVILEDEAFAKFCQSVCESTATVSRPPTPPRGGGRRKGPRLIPGR
ncbi:hypothetical protein FMEXI_5160 [Fusarium mexicanum]|uniref:Uncharacterized protein n=1 Tax=Fusarium mexicanum TaxID=751941 RepID=A0A8H5N048_9HYPO|nr:hypothetical protein FMEXI_5160 [Fusarium mexicanum]